MANTVRLEQLIELYIIQEDAETIFSLLKSEKDPIYGSEVIPYYALFVQSCQEYFNKNYLPDNIANEIKDIRNHIKSYADRFQKTKKELTSMDNKQDEIYRPKIRPLERLNYHSNIGTFWTEDHHVIGNTQRIYDILGLSDPNSSEAKKKIYDITFHIASFVSSVRRGGEKHIKISPVNRSGLSATIKYKYDFNTTRKRKTMFTGDDKAVNLYFLNLLCDMNFTKYVLRPLFGGDNSWLFRVEYIVTYYTYRALIRLRNHDENYNMEVDLDGLNRLLEEKNVLFKKNFRSMMMHYRIENPNIISAQYIKQPLFGLVENCFDGLDYYTYLDRLHAFSDEIIYFLESKFNNSVNLSLL